MLFDLDDTEETRAVSLYLAMRRKEGAKIGLTSGCFDLIHFQHVHYFKRCKRHCNVLIVGVDADEMVRALKGPHRPFIFDFKRAIMVDSLKDVAYTFVMNGLDELGHASKLFNPDVLIRNSDFAGREHEVIGREHAGKVVIVHDVEDHASTTDISRSIAARLAAPK